MTKWIAPTVLGILVAANVVLFACGSADKWIKMDIPPEMQAIVHVGPRITVAEALPTFERWELEVKLCTEEFMDEYLDKMALVAYVNATVGQLGSMASTALGASPFAALSPLLIGGIALMVRSPGTRAREKRIGDAAEARGITLGKNGTGPDSTPT